MENINLLKTNKRNFLFIPSDKIISISCSGFREILSADYINKQFANLSVQHEFEDSGLIIPIEYSNKMFAELDEYELGILNQIKQIKKY